jgi:hypothetical protein
MMMLLLLLLLLMMMMMMMMMMIMMMMMMMMMMGHGFFPLAGCVSVLPKVGTFHTMSIAKQATNDTKWVYTWASNMNITNISVGAVRWNDSLNSVFCSAFAMNQVPDEGYCNSGVFFHAYYTTVWHIVFYVIYLFFVIVGLASGQAIMFLRCCSFVARGIHFILWIFLL